jgi:hypothetical protein
MKIEVIARLKETGNWFSGRKDGSGTIAFDFDGTQFPQAIQISRYMDTYTHGQQGKTFKLTIEDDE